MLSKIVMVSHQYPYAPEVYFVIFVQPGSILFESMTGEDYQQIVCEGNQAKDNECSNHRPLKKCKEFIRILKTVNNNERGKYNI